MFVDLGPLPRHVEQSVPLLRRGHLYGLCDGLRVRVRVLAIRVRDERFAALGAFALRTQDGGETGAAEDVLAL